MTVESGGTAVLRPAGAAAFERLRPEDEDALAALFIRNDLPGVVRHFHPFALSRETAEALCHGAGRDRYYGAWVDGSLAGMSMLRGFDEGYRVPSLGVMIDRGQWGRGLGRWLVARTCQDAREMDCERVRLSVFETNERARRLYQGLGFLERERRDVISAGEHDVRIAMELELESIPRRIPVAAPALVGNEAVYVQDCVRSTWISSNGPYIARLEKEFAAFCEARHAIACCNGTAALHLALLAAGVGPGDEVIVPALSYVACGNAIAYCGATPVLADSDAATGALDPDAAAAVVTSRTRAILAVHLYGHPADMDALRAIAERHDLTLVEDAAEAHGARCRGARVGSLGDIATFSFYGNKILSSGEGGMVLTGDSELARTVRLLAGQGQDPYRRYWHPVRGFNYRMTNLAAAIGVAQLEQVEWHLARRRQLMAWYREELEDDPRLTLVDEEPWATSVHWMVCALLAESDERNAIMRRMDERGIETRPFFQPLHLLPTFGGHRGEFPVAEHLAARGICLPTSATLTRGDVQRVAAALRDAL